MFLATTALSEFWDKQQEEFLFLGPWCRRFDRRRDWQELRAETLPSPWEDRERFHAAAEYLDARVEQILPPLADCLDTQLGHSGNPRYWRILIGTWLMHSLHITYDRYIHLSKAFEKHPDLQTLLLDPASFQTPQDTEQAIDGWMTEDLCNLQTFSQLMTQMGYSFPARTPREEAPAGNGISPVASLKQGFRGVLRWTESAFFKMVEGRSETALMEMYCPSSVVWTLAWKSGFRAAPLTLPVREKEPAAAPGRNRRRAALSELPAADEFMRLWIRSLPENFPTLYLEEFHSAREQALRRLRRVPRTMVSSNGWHFSEPLKFFAAELSRRGGRLVAVQHGSGYGLFRSMPMEQHERRISDSFLGWEEAPPLQLAALRNRGRRRAVAKSRRLLYVATTNPRYLFRFYSAPQAHQLGEYFEWQVLFLEGIGDAIRNRLAVRLYPHDFGHCLRQRLEQNFKNLQWDKKRQFAGSAAMSRLIIVDHPGTSMLAALAGNFPTLLFWNPRLWEFRPEARSHLELLQQAGLFYNDPRSAARALEEILREGSERWWNGAAVQSARRRFVERYASIPRDWLRLWSERIGSL